MKNHAIHILNKAITDLNNSNRWFGSQIRRKGIPYPYSPKKQTLTYKKEYRKQINENKVSIKELKQALKILSIQPR